MSKTASFLCFLMSLILIGEAALTAYQNMQSSPERIREGFAALGRRDYMEVDRQIAEQKTEEQTREIRAVVGVIFLIGGFAIWPRSDKPAPKKDLGL